MALPTSGALTLSNIQTEFGGSNPIGLNEYYAGGSYVPAGTSGTYGAVPSSGALSVQNFYGTQSYTPIYAEDVFSTYTYTGNGVSSGVGQTINNGIDLAGNGGLVWTKARELSGYGHALFSNATGLTKQLSTDTSGAQQTTNDSITSFNSNGYTLGTDYQSGLVNYFSSPYVSWTFRKKSKFFDIVTWTGDGTNNRNIAHNLGSVPGCIMAKRTDSTSDWLVYHVAAGGQVLVLNSIYGAGVFYTPGSFGNGSTTMVTPTSSVFTVGGATINASGGTYVAYIFAHNAGGFGPTGTDSVVSCGSYTGDGSSPGPIVTVGFEPQWLLVKCSSTSGNWVLVDTFRGMPVRGTGYTGTALLYSNLNNLESADAYTGVAALPTGFQLNTTIADLNTSGQTYTYIAIRRTGEKVPTDATKVFNAVAYSNSGLPNGNTRSTGNQPDLIISKGRAASYGNYPMWYDRMRGGDAALNSSSSSGESAGYQRYKSFNKDSVTYGYDGSAPYVNGPGTFIAWVLTRAKGFFDQVLYTGNGTNGQQIGHNLGVIPDLIIIKARSGTSNWSTFVRGITAYPQTLDLSTSDNATNTYDQYGGTATSFQLNGSNSSYISKSGTTYVAYLFATCAGVSKVGSYTGTGAAQTINCGFAAGARFVMIKRVGAGNWYVFDTVRGIVSGNDPFSTINDSSGESSGDWLSPQSSGFGLTAAAPADLNASGGTFIYLAIA